jgi:hypothetical protein
MIGVSASLSRRSFRFTSPQRLVRSISSTKYNDLEPTEQKENILPVRLSIVEKKTKLCWSTVQRQIPRSPLLVSTDTLVRNIRQFVPDLLHDGNIAGVCFGRRSILQTRCHHQLSFRKGLFEPALPRRTRSSTIPHGRRAMHRLQGMALEIVCYSS